MLLEDLTGQTFGRLRVEECVGKPESGKITKYVCFCDPELEYPKGSKTYGCGTVTEVFETHLKYGKTHSCGCLQVESRSTKDRLTVRFRPTYMEWYSKRRYKGNLAPEWEDDKKGFERFLRDMGKRPHDKYAHLRKIDKRMHYSKDNAAWFISAEHVPGAPKESLFAGMNVTWTDKGVMITPIREKSPEEQKANAAIERLTAKGKRKTLKLNLPDDGAGQKRVAG